MFRWSRPFAIVPCCVFSREFPHRIKPLPLRQPLSLSLSLSESSQVPVASHTSDISGITSSAEESPSSRDHQKNSEGSEKIGITDVDIDAPTHRRITSFKDFVAYLTAKSCDIQKSRLNVQGKNLVLYTPGRAESPRAQLPVREHAHAPPSESMASARDIQDQDIQRTAAPAQVPIDSNSRS